MLFTIFRRWLGPEKSQVDSGLMFQFGKTTFHALIRFNLENQASPVPEAVRLKFSVFFRLNTIYIYIYIEILVACCCFLV